TTGTLTMRPMDATWFIVAHELTPDSFVGFNLYTMLTFFLKGLLLYAILHKLLPENPLFAIGAALLFIIFPADDGLFTFRGMNIHTAVCLYLFAVYLLLSYHEKPRLLKLIGIWVSLIVCLFTYELPHPLIAVTPLILIWKERQFSKSLFRVALLWWAAPLTAFLYAVAVFSSGSTYQSSVLGLSGLNRPGVVGEIVETIWMTYRRHFIDGWVIALQQINLTTSLIPFALAVGGMAAATIGVHLPAARHLTPAGNRRYVELFMIGILIIFLGYIVYLITPYRQLTWRMYYFSGIGGAICITSLVYLLVRGLRQWQVVFAAGMCVLISLAGVRALAQHEYYVGLSGQQQQLLRGIARAVPNFKVPAPLVVVDETGRYQNNWSLGTSYLVENALRYLYDDYTLHAVLCSFKPEQGVFAVLPELREQCEFDTDALRLFQDGAQVQSLDYSKMIIVSVTEAGVRLLDSIPPEFLDGAGGEGYNPLPLVDSTAPLPYRYNTLFSIAD
ncbi:MAG: hypothetical protein ABI835_12195, partial [Chloroflexota bacterium]